MEINAKDMECLFEELIFDLKIFDLKDIDKKPVYDMNKVYYVLQGPKKLMDLFVMLNFGRPKLNVAQNPYNRQLESPVYLSNYPSLPEFRFNAHLDNGLINTRVSNLIKYKTYKVPDFTKIFAEMEKDVSSEEQNRDLIRAIIKNGEDR